MFGAAVMVQSSSPKKNTFLFGESVTQNKINFKYFLARPTSSSISVIVSLFHCFYSILNDILWHSTWQTLGISHCVNLRLMQEGQCAFCYRSDNQRPNEPIVSHTLIYEVRLSSAFTKTNGKHFGVALC